MDIKNWQVFVHDKGMMVPGILGKYGRAFDHLPGLTKSDKILQVSADTIMKNYGFIVSRVSMSRIEGMC